MASTLMAERFNPDIEPLPEMHAQHQARYEFARKFVGGKRVADIACGTGYGSRILLAGSPERVIGVDISVDAIAHAQATYGAPGIEFLQGGSEALLQHRPLDVVVSFETIEHVRGYDRFLSEIADALSPEGMLIISTPLRAAGSFEDRPSNPFHVQEWNADEFGALLGRYFAGRENFWQFVYARRWYPGSRTIHRALARLLYPAASAEFDTYAVGSAFPKMPAIPVVQGFAVTVCTRPSGRVRR